MERVEIFRGHTFVLKTQQLGPQRWSCDVFGREGQQHAEHFLLQEFGDSELEAVAMALSDVHEYHN